MSAFPNPSPAAAVMPLSTPSPVRRDWSAFGLPQHGWVQVVDKDLCRLCPTNRINPCTAACMKQHRLAPEARIPLQACAHCDPAPCAEACPTDAIFHNAQGVVEVDQELCIGCHFCEDACENGALLYVDPFVTAPPPLGVQGYSPGQPSGALPSTVAKCTLCSDRLTRGELPYCADACPNGAVWIGNLDRDTVTNGIEVYRLSQLLGERSFQILAPGNRVVHLR